jgi:hypothetical protein
LECLNTGEIGQENIGDEQIERLALSGGNRFRAGRGNLDIKAGIGKDLASLLAQFGVIFENEYMFVSHAINPQVSITAMPRFSKLCFLHLPALSGILSAMAGHARVAFVASWLNQHGGAERCLEAAHQVFPEAPIFTSTYWPAAMPPEYRTWDIRVSFLNHLPIANQRLLLPLYPLAFESLDLSGYDRVLSLTSAFAHGIRLPPGAKHFCYLFTPARFLWNYRDYVERERIGPLPRLVLPLFISTLREWDRRAAQRVTTHREQLPPRFNHHLPAGASGPLYRFCLS